MNCSIMLEVIIDNISLEPTIAFLPLLWLAGAILVGGGTVLAIAIANSDGSENNTKIVGKSMGILGPQESGKTQLLKTLQNKPYEKYEATSTDDYSAFSTEINGRTITFQHGRDIGGDEKYIKDYYKKFILEKDAIFFVFDVTKYLNDNSYAFDVRARIDFIYDHLKQINNYQSKYLLIGSHMDKLSSSRQKEALKTLQSSVAGKRYSTMFHNNLLLCDLTDRSNFLKNLIERKIL